MSTQEHRHAVVAEFYREKNGVLMLFAVWTNSDEYPDAHDLFEVDYCERDRDYLYHNSGGGPFSPEHPICVSGIYWTSMVDRIKEEDGAERLEKLPIDFDDEQDLFQWLENNWIESETVYCPICNDRFPVEQECNHIWHCDEGGGWQGNDEGGEMDCRCRCCTNGIQRRLRALHKLPRELYEVYDATAVSFHEAVGDEGEPDTWYYPALLLMEKVAGGLKYGAQ